MLQDFGKMEFRRRRIDGVLQGKKEESVVVLGAIGFRSGEDGGMEGMENAAVAEQEGDDSGLSFTLKVKTQFNGSLDDAIPHFGSNTGTSTDNARNGRSANMAGAGDVTERDFGRSSGHQLVAKRVERFDRDEDDIAR
jgi:hypothetical protein